MNPTGRVHSSETLPALAFVDWQWSSSSVGGGSHTISLSLAHRGLLRVALQRKGQALEEDEDTETR